MENRSVVDVVEVGLMTKRPQKDISKVSEMPCMAP